MVYNVPNNKTKTGGKASTAQSTNGAKLTQINVSSRRNRRRAIAHDMSTTSEYEHCVLSGTDINASGSGFPDGNPQPSVTLDYKQIITLKPDASGVIDFVFAPSATSCLNMITGSTTGIVVDGYIPDATTISGFKAVTKAADKPGVISIGTLVPPELFMSSSAPMSATTNEFRPVVMVADVEYTGSSMMNNGSVVVTNLPNSETVFSAVSVPAATAYNADRVAFNSFNATQVGPKTQVLSAREGFTTRIVANEPKYETVRSSVMTYDANSSRDTRPMAYYTSGSTGTQTLAPSYHSSCEWIRVTYSGLDTSASITLTIRYCVQFAINQSSSANAAVLMPLSRPSPASKPGIVTRVTNIIRSAPLATKKGFSFWDIIKRAGKAILPTVLPGPGHVVASLL